MLEEKLTEIQMVFIQTTGKNNYSVECVGRGRQTTKLNFKDVEGIELENDGSFEIKNTYLRMSDTLPRAWNIRFAYPTNLTIRFTGTIVIRSA